MGGVGGRLIGTQRAEDIPLKTKTILSWAALELRDLETNCVLIGRGLSCL